MTYLSGMTTLSSLGDGIFELGDRDDGDGMVCLLISNMLTPASGEGASPGTELFAHVWI